MHFPLNLTLISYFFGEILLEIDFSAISRQVEARAVRVPLGLDIAARSFAFLCDDLQETPVIEAELYRAAVDLLPGEGQGQGQKGNGSGGFEAAVQ